MSNKWAAVFCILSLGAPSAGFAASCEKMLLAISPSGKKGQILETLGRVAARGSPFLKWLDDHGVMIQGIQDPPKQFYHQIPNQYVSWLEARVGKSFGDVPSDWVGRGPHAFIFMDRKPYYGDYGRNETFQLRLRPDYKIVRVGQLMDAPDESTLAHCWKTYLETLGDKQPKNEFSLEVQILFQKRGLIDHSEFYRQTQIGAVLDHHVFMLLNPEAGEIRHMRKFKSGTTVKIIRGPYAGQNATVVRVVGIDNQVKYIVDVPNRTDLEIDGEDLQKGTSP